MFLDQQVPIQSDDSESSKTSDETVKKLFPIPTAKPKKVIVSIPIVRQSSFIFQIQHKSRAIYPAIEYQSWTNPIERELQRLRHQVRMLEDQLYRLQRKFKEMSRKQNKRDITTPIESQRETPIIVEFTRKLTKIHSDPSYVFVFFCSFLDVFSSFRSSTKPSTSSETPMTTDFPTNQNFNQSNNNDLVFENDDEDDDEDGAEKILDAFERSYLSRLEAKKQPMKVKYIPKDRSSTWPNRKTLLFT